MGIIDSGINKEALEADIIQKQLCLDRDDARDVNGHGTMCTWIIKHMINQAVEFISAKIFHKELKAKEQQVYDALVFMMDMQVDIINMSLSISLSESKRLYDLCKRLQGKGVILISSFANSGRNTLFENYDSIITVSGSSFFDGKKYWYNKNRAVCDIEPVLACCNVDTYNFFGGNSKATALFTAIVINSWNIKKGKFDLDLVRECAQRNVWLPCNLQRTSALFVENKDIENRDINLVMEYMEDMLGISKEILKESKNWLTYEINLSPNKINKIIEHIKSHYPKLRSGQEVFQEYFRNYNNFKMYLSS